MNLEDIIAEGAGGPGKGTNIRSVAEGLRAADPSQGLDRPHRLAHYLCQVAHESGRFRYDEEIWGPTPAQQRYDTRTDLGNTPERDGDGFLYRGRGPMQATGKTNYRGFRDWARLTYTTREVPDFVADPDAILTDPWEGLFPIWFWWRNGLSRYADRNDIEMVTRRINGGLNGYADRVALYTRYALVLLGYRPTAVREFQSQTMGLVADGIAGPRTRAALHEALVGRPRIDFGGRVPQTPELPATGDLSGLLARIIEQIAAAFRRMQR